MREREVEAGHHRVEDEDEEPDDPRRHEQQHRAVVAQRRRAAADAARPPAPAIGPRRDGDGARSGYPSCALLVDLVSDASGGPAAGSGPLPGQVLVDEVLPQVWSRRSPERRDLLVARVRVREDLEERLEVRVAGQRRVLQRVEASSARSSAPRPASSRRCVSVARYFTSSHASAGCWLPRGMPMMSPPIWPRAVRAGAWSSATGNGRGRVVDVRLVVLDERRRATRRRCVIATLPVLEALRGRQLGVGAAERREELLQLVVARYVSRRTTSAT